MDECAFIQEAAWTEGAAPGAVGPAGAGALHQHAEGSQLVLASLEPWPGGRDRWASWRFPGVESIYCSQRDRGGAGESANGCSSRSIWQSSWTMLAAFSGVMEAATATAVEPDPAGSYVMGVDWGKQNDYTVLVVLDTVAGAMVAFDRMNRIDYAIQTERLQVLAERWNVSNIVAERNSMGEPLIEQLSRDGLPVTSFRTTAQSKAQTIDALALAFERSEIRILPDRCWSASCRHTDAAAAVGDDAVLCAGWDAR